MPSEPTDPADPAGSAESSGSTRPIRANSVLPADRTPITLRTADGLRLVGELALPVDRDPRATLICVHPLPTHGGMMDSHIFRKAAYRLPALAGLAVLRFNTRGTESAQGRSEGEFDSGRAERYDLAAALAFARGHAPRLPELWMVGWSFGTDLVLRYGLEPDVRGAVLLSPSLRWSGPTDLTPWAESGKPLTVFVPEFDENLPPGPAAERFAAIPQAEVVAVERGRHLWVGKAEEILDGIVGRVVPNAAPLPREWSGPMEAAEVPSDYADRTVAAYADVPVDPPSGA